MLALPGIDTEHGLSLFAGNMDSYRKILLKFFKQHHSNVVELSQAMQLEDFATAERIAHSLKSVAGNIGAKQLQQQALLAEQCFKQREVLPNEQLDTLNSLMQQVLVSIETSSLLTEKPIANTQGQSNLLSLKPEFNKLKALLLEYDTQAQDVYDGIMAQLAPGEVLEQLKTLQQPMDEYDSELAAQMLDKVLAQHL